MLLSPMQSEEGRDISFPSPSLFPSTPLPFPLNKTPPPLPPTPLLKSITRHASNKEQSIIFLSLSSVSGYNKLNASLSRSFLISVFLLTHTHFGSTHAHAHTDASVYNLNVMQ